MDKHDVLGHAQTSHFGSEQEQLEDTLRALHVALDVTTREFPSDTTGLMPKAYILGLSEACTDKLDVRLMLHSSGVAGDLINIMDAMLSDLLLSMLRDGIKNPDEFTMVMARLSTMVRYTDLPRTQLRESIEAALRSRPDLYRRGHGREHDSTQEQTGPSRTLN